MYDIIAQMEGMMSKMENEMSRNTKLEVALEVLSAKIANMVKKGYTVEDEELKVLIKERDKMYSEDEEVIEKIIKEYGPEIKKNYEGV